MYLLPLLTCFSKTCPLFHTGSFFQLLASAWGAALNFVSKYTKINCIQSIFCNLKLPPEQATSKPNPKLSPLVWKIKSKTKPESLLPCFLPTFWFAWDMTVIQLNKDQNQTRASHSNGGKQDATPILPETPDLKIAAPQFIGKLLVIIFLALRSLPRE